MKLVERLTAILEKIVELVDKVDSTDVVVAEKDAIIEAKEAEIAALAEELTAVKNKIGVSEYRADLIDEYVYFFRKNFEEELENLDKANFTVAIDTANGATSLAAEKVFTALGIKHYIMNNTPNGVNINENCGSTHLDMIKKYGDKIEKVYFVCFSQGDYEIYEEILNSKIGD